MGIFTSKDDDGKDVKLTGWSWGKDDTSGDEDTDTPSGWLSNWLKS